MHLCERKVMEISQESQPLLGHDERRGSVQIQYFQNMMQVALICDGLTSTTLYLIYMILNPIPWSEISLQKLTIPLDLLMISWFRIGLLAWFIVGNSILIKARIPLFTTFVRFVALTIGFVFVFICAE